MSQEEGCGVSDGTWFASTNSCCHYGEPENPYIAGGGYLCEICNDGVDNDCDGATDAEQGACYNCHPSPILIDVAGNGFILTNAANGVLFDISGNDRLQQLAWTAPNSDDAFLVLDRDASGAIEDGKELFGNFTWQAYKANSPPNGFTALAEFDTQAQGGHVDNVIDSRDAVFANLRLWQDANHDGVSQPGELHTLLELGLASIDLSFKTSKRIDANGNEFRFRAKVTDARGSQGGHWAWDVFFVSAN